MGSVRSARSSDRSSRRPKRVAGAKLIVAAEEAGEGTDHETTITQDSWAKSETVAFGPKVGVFSSVRYMDRTNFALESSIDFLTVYRPSFLVKTL